MAQRTVVVRLDPGEQERLEERLAAGGFEFRPVDHARFSARGGGVVATLYTSGKLVVQGDDIEVFAARFLDESAAPLRPSARASRDAALVPPPEAPIIGSDETGKGDYFGPLVVCAVKLEPGQRAELKKGGVMDSKRLADETVARLAPAIMERYPCAVERLDPPAYNREHARVKNVNRILSEMHAKAIRRLAEPGIDVLVDQFARDDLLQRMLADTGVALRQSPRAESLEPAVAAASVVARAVFLDGLAELSEAFAVDLHKGAGAPTDAAGRRFVAIHGRDKLAEVAKLHFKNTAKIAGSRP